MSKDSSQNNLVLFGMIIESLKKMLATKNEATIEVFLSSYSGNPDATEQELINAISWANEMGYISIEERKPAYNSIVRLSDSQIVKDIGNLRIVISMPKNMELGLSRVASRNQMIETRQAFREVFLAAKRTLRIASPFFEKSILRNEGLPDLEDYIKFAFERGCNVIILTRVGERDDFQWLRILAEDSSFVNSLRIFEYHHSDSNGRVLSSVHSKMIIADASMAYVGSAEIRKNSLENNFEVGCLIEGPSVAGLCEAFDLMIRYSKEVK